MASPDDAASPRRVLDAWFEAHARGDLAAAAALMSPGAPIETGAERLEGFDGLMEWYAARRHRLPDLTYRVEDVLHGERHAAAVLAMTDGERTWRQIALYRVEDGRIVAVTVHEDAPR